jgi:hypothetical protein
VVLQGFDRSYLQRDYKCDNRAVCSRPSDAADQRAKCTYHGRRDGLGRALDLPSRSAERRGSSSSQLQLYNLPATFRLVSGGRIIPRYCAKVQTIGIFDFTYDKQVDVQASYRIPHAHGIQAVVVAQSNQRSLRVLSRQRTVSLSARTLQPHGIGRLALDLLECKMSNLFGNAGSSRATQGRQDLVRLESLLAILVFLFLVPALNSAGISGIDRQSYM